METILFVCTGNTCRSCMAEGIFNYLASRDSELAGRFCASSAGIAAFNGQPASDNAVQVLKDDLGIDISSHSSRAADLELFENALLVITMTRAHKQAVVSAFPHLKSKVFALKEYAADNFNSLNKEYNYSLDIGDPFGLSAHVYRLCAREIRKETEKLISKLKKTML